MNVVVDESQDHLDLLTKRPFVANQKDVAQSH
jgi:hypothetical protein